MKPALLQLDDTVNLIMHHFQSTHSIIPSCTSFGCNHSPSSRRFVLHEIAAQPFCKANEDQQQLHKILS